MNNKYMMGRSKSYDMETLTWLGYLLALTLGLLYIVAPVKVHKFGFNLLRRSSSPRSESSTNALWIYRALGSLFLFIGATGLFLN